MPDRSSLLDHLAEEDRRALIALSARRSFRRGEVVFRHGDPGEIVHLVLRGVFLVRLATDHGGELASRLAGAGDLFGELAALSGARGRSETVTAISSAETRMIDVTTFDTMRRRNPSLDRYLVELLSRRTSQLARLLCEAYFKPVDTRVGRRLIELDRYTSPDPDGERWIHISQQDLAALAGTTRPTVNRVLRRAAANGWIDVARGRIHVRDTQSLVTALC